MKIYYMNEWGCMTKATDKKSANIWEEIDKQVALHLNDTEYVDLLDVVSLWVVDNDETAKTKAQEYADRLGYTLEDLTIYYKHMPD